jgi:outer membrane protein OmpA-like peptidoglycan-associated protein
MLLGFSDAAPCPNPDPTCSALSLERARSVATALEAELNSAGVRVGQIQPVSMGQEMPVAPNDYPEGQERNRRVEVWFE